MIRILVDHNIEGQALLMWRSLVSEGWPELLQMEMVLFTQAGLSYSTNDREVWRFAQENGMVLLTANRNMKDKDSLEQTILEENTPTSLPVVTIGNINRLAERAYRERCESRLLDIVAELHIFIGTGRIYIP